MSILSGPFKLKPSPTKPPPILASIVQTAALAAYCHRCPLTPYVLPLLNANQPHLIQFLYINIYLIIQICKWATTNYLFYQSTNKPMIALTGHPRGNGSIPLSYLPTLGPNIRAQASAIIN